MKGNGNGIGTLFQKLRFYCITNSSKRTKYIIKHKKQFKAVGEGLFWQSRLFPTDPELISIGDNVKIAANVQFINHDIVHYMLNDSRINDRCFSKNQGCIEIGSNVMIGSNVIILPNVRIGCNVVIGAGAVVTKDIPSNSVAGGVPCKVIGSFGELVTKRLAVTKKNAKELWDDFYGQRE